MHTKSHRAVQKTVREMKSGGKSVKMAAKKVGRKVAGTVAKVVTSLSRRQAALKGWETRRKNARAAARNTASVKTMTSKPMTGRAR